MTYIAVVGGNQTGKLGDFNELHKPLFTGKGTRHVVCMNKKHL